MADKLDLIIEGLSKGRDVPVTRMNSADVLSKVPGFVSTGFVPLDLLLGGGWPIRRIVEVYGENSSGKSMLAAYACNEAIKMGCMAVYADVEVATNVERMEMLGLNTSQVIYDSPNSLEDTFQLLESSIELKNKHYSVDKPLIFVIDSIAALVTADEQKAKEYERKDYPRAASYLSATMRKMKNVVAANNVLLFLINQTRQKLGVMFGDGLSTYGGEAIKFYASIRVELENRGSLKQGTEVVGINTKFTSVKNRLAAPYRCVTLPIYYDERALNADELMFNLLHEYGIFTTSGAWHTLQFYEDDEVKFQGKSFVEKVLDARWDDLIELLEEIFGKLPEVYNAS